MQEEMHHASTHPKSAAFPARESLGISSYEQALPSARAPCLGTEEKVRRMQQQLDQLSHLIKSSELSMRQVANVADSDHTHRSVRRKKIFQEAKAAQFQKPTEVSSTFLSNNSPHSNARLNRKSSDGERARKIARDEATEEEPTRHPKGRESKTHFSMRRHKPARAEQVLPFPFQQWASHRDPPPQVFLCHTGQDKPFAFRIDLILQALGYDVFMDRSSLRSGRPFEDDIAQACHAVDVAIVFVSHKTFKRKWVLREIATLLARHNKDPSFLLLPLILDPEACASGGEMGKELEALSGIALRARDDIGELAIVSATCGPVTRRLSGCVVPDCLLMRVMRAVYEEQIRWNSLNATPERLETAVNHLRKRVAALRSQSCIPSHVSLSQFEGIVGQSTGRCRAVKAWVAANGSARLQLAAGDGKDCEEDGGVEDNDDDNGDSLLQLETRGTRGVQGSRRTSRAAGPNEMDN